MNMHQLRIDSDKKISLWRRFNFWFYDKFKYSWYYKYLVYPIKDFKIGIRNIIKWMPIVWKDRDWDDSYIFDALRFKIKNTRDNIVARDIIIDEQLNIMKRDMTTSINLIDKVQEETYSMEYLDYLDKKIWFEDYVDADHPSTMQLKRMESVTVEDRLDKYFAKYPLDKRRAIKYIIEKLKQEDRVEDREFIALIMAKLRHEKASRILFNILHERIEHWWD